MSSGRRPSSPSHFHHRECGPLVSEVSMSRSELNEFLRIYGVVPATFVPITLLTSMFPARLVARHQETYYAWIFGDNVEDRMVMVAWSSTCCVRRDGRGRTNPDESRSLLPTIGASECHRRGDGRLPRLYPKSRVLTLDAGVRATRSSGCPAVALLGVWFLMQLVNAGAVAAWPTVPEAAAWPSWRGGIRDGCGRASWIPQSSQPDRLWACRPARNR